MRRAASTTVRPAFVLSCVQGTERGRRRCCLRRRGLRGADAPVRVIDAFVDGMKISEVRFGRYVTAATGRPPYDLRDIWRNSIKCLAVPGACMLSQNRVMRLLRRRSRIRTATVVATAQPQAQHGLYVIRLLWLRFQAAMHHSRAPFPQASSRRGRTHSDECESQSRTHD